MNKNLLWIACLVFTLLQANSCMRVFSETIENTQERAFLRKHSIVETKGTIEIDSLDLIIARQNDPDLRMLNQVIFVDDHYCIALSAEEAMLVGISPSIYNKYQKYVDQLNKRIKDNNHD